MNNTAAAKAELAAAIRPRITVAPSPPPEAGAGIETEDDAGLEPGTVAAGRMAVPTGGRTPEAAGTPGFVATALPLGTREVSFLGATPGVAGRAAAAAPATAPAATGRGGRLIRTVSFFGAFAGAATGLIAPGGGAAGATPDGFTTAPGCGTELGGGVEEPEIGWVGGTFSAISAQANRNGQRVNPLKVGRRPRQRPGRTVTSARRDDKLAAS